MLSLRPLIAVLLLVVPSLAVAVQRSSFILHRSAFSVHPSSFSVQDGERAPHRITAAPVEFPTAFTVVRAVMALPDGRLVLSDPEDNKLSLLDFAKGTSKPLSRIGQGPQEYKVLGGLYRAKGGGVFVYDQGQRRLLPISPRGELQDVVQLPIPGMSSSGGNLRPDRYASDTLGNAVGFADGGRGSFLSDSAMLVRFRKVGKPDSIAKLVKRGSKILEQTANTTRSQEILFSNQDAWVFAPDGTIGLIRTVPYHVEWIPLTGPVVKGAAINYTPVKVSKVDRDEVIAKRPAGGGQPSVSMGGGSRGGQSTQPAPLPMTPSEPLIADVKAPFNPATGHWPLLDEQVHVWVERYQAAGKKSALFDVIDRKGNVIDRIELPTGSSLVGFDKTWLYTVRVDDDDFQHLQRFPLPKMP